MPDPANPPAAGSAAAPDFRQLVADAVAAADRNPHRVAKALLGRIKELEQQLATAVPAGAVVLSAEDAETWKGYRALGKLDEVKATVAKVPALEGQLAERETADKRRASGKAAAKALGWNEDVTVDLISDKGLPVELREVEVEEKDAKGTVTKVKKSLPHVVRGEGAAQTVERLDAVIARDFAGYLPALQPSAGGAGGGGGAGGSGGSGGAGGSSRGRTITYPAQRSGESGGAPATSAVDERLERNRERSQAANALRPAKASA